MDFLFGYQESKIKPYLKMASQRLTMAMNKKRNTGIGNLCSCIVLKERINGVSLYYSQSTEEGDSDIT
jgi:hypothetical protein